MNDRAAAIAYYQQHIDEVMAAIPAERLLIYSVDQGWEPLCRFLGVPAPVGDFPNVNDRAQFGKRLARMSGFAYGILAVAAMATVAVVYGATRLLR